MAERIFRKSLSQPRLSWDGRMVEGYASVFGNIDHDADVIQRGAFSKTLQERGHTIKVLSQHDRTRPLGPLVEAAEDDYGLRVKFIISETSYGNDILALLRDYQATGREGDLFPMSIMLEVINARTEKREGRNVRVITEAKLYEVSLVTFPANEQARAMHLKGACGGMNFTLARRDREWDAAAARRRVAEWAMGEGGEIDFSRYRQAFFWYDESGPDKVGSYKLPFVDIAGGEPVAVPRAIFGVAGVLQGARGGVDIPEEDIAGIKRKVGRYYARMREEFGDAEISPPWEAESAYQLAGGVTKEFLSDGSVITRLGDTLEGALHEQFTLMADSWFRQGLLTRDQRIQLSDLIGQALGLLHTGIPTEVANIPLSYIPDWLSWITIKETTSSTGEDESIEQEITSPEDRAGPQTVAPTRREELAHRLAEMKSGQGLQGDVK